MLPDESISEYDEDGATRWPAVGSQWRNRHTGEVEVIEAVGPCFYLRGQERIWFEGEQEWNNGWSLYFFLRCWVPASEVAVCR